MCLFWLFFMLCGRGIPFFIFSFSFPICLLEMEGGHIWVVCLSWEAWNGEGVFYILLWLCVLSYYTFCRVFGGWDENGLDEGMTGMDVYAT